METGQIVVLFRGSAPYKNVQSVSRIVLHYVSAFPWPELVIIMKFSGVFEPIPRATTQPLPYLQQINLSELATSRVVRQLLACLATICCAFLFRRKPVRQFPGPAAWPIIGNLASIYHCHAERQFLKWAKVYGDVVQVQFGFMAILVVNSAAAAKDIFAGSATALSSRPVFHTFHNVYCLFILPTTYFVSQESLITRVIRLSLVH